MQDRKKLRPHLITCSVDLWRTPREDIYTLYKLYRLHGRQVFDSRVTFPPASCWRLVSFEPRPAIFEGRCRYRLFDALPNYLVPVNSFSVSLLSLQTRLIFFLMLRVLVDDSRPSGTLPLRKQEWPPPLDGMEIERV